VGFTDIVKRPTSRATDVRPEEYEHGQPLLEGKLERYRPAVVIFTFKASATKLFGSFYGNGFVPGLQLAHSAVYVMPGPFQSADSARPILDELAAYFS